MISTVVAISVALATTLIVALVAFLFGGRGTAVRAFGRALVASSICLSGLLLVVIAKSIPLQVVGVKIAGVGMALLPPQLVLLNMKLEGRIRGSFPTKHKMFAIGSYIVTLWVVYLVLTDRFVVGGFSLAEGELLRLKPRAAYFVIYLVIVFSLMFLNLQALFQSFRTRRQKGSRVVVVSGIVAFLLAIVLSSHIFVTAAITSDVVRVASFAVAFFAFVLTVLMMRTRPLDEGIAVSRQATYSSILFLLVGGLLIAIGIIAKILEALGGDMRAFYSVLAGFALLVLLAAIVTSASIKERVKAFVDRNLFGGTYDYREIWSRFSDQTAEDLELHEVVRRLSQFVRTVLSAEHAAVLVMDEISNQFVLKEIVGRPQPVEKVRIPASGDFADWLWRWAKPVTEQELNRRKETRDLVPGWQGAADGIYVAVWVPLIARGEFVGIMALGQLDRGRRYRQTDLEFLEMLANHSAVAILNSRMKEELIASKELESFYKVSSFVLHDLRNIVSGLDLTLKNAENHIADRGFQRDMLHTVSRSVETMKRTMSKLSSVADGLTLKKTPVSVDQLVRDVLAEVGLCHNSRVSVSAKLRARRLLMLDQGQLHRLVANLVVNAMEAMPFGGRLQIRTNLLPSDRPEKEGNQSLLQIQIQDSGVGIAQDFVERRLFRPFATTKKRGLGLGLYQCREIARAHGGDITVTSKPNQGATFTVTIPAEPGNIMTSEPVAMV